MPNILDDIIASVVENKIPAGRGAKLSIKLESAPAVEEAKVDRKKPPAVTMATEEPANQHPNIPHCWLYERRMLWLKDHRNGGNWRLFRECWRQGQVSPSTAALCQIGFNDPSVCQ